jgi:myo-inositol-1-phosphate synthase
MEKTMGTLEVISSRPLLLLIAGAKGAIGSTLALASLIMQRQPDIITPYLTTTDLWEGIGASPMVHVAGWDVSAGSMSEALALHRVVPEPLWQGLRDALDGLQTAVAPEGTLSLNEQVAQLMRDIDTFRKAHPDAQPVMVNLLPACPGCSLPEKAKTDGRGAGQFPDLAYARAAIQTGVPVVNFTPNALGDEALVATAEERRLPLVGRDGKTGQTYFKVVLASALKARHLKVEGWYSLNILGNADGRNLMDPDCARGKLANKTELLDEVLGYRVGEAYGESTHKVHIDYYPPRGDAKEAWDVIDIKGLFGLPMSIRVNLQGRDSILAAPMTLDLARWVVLLQAVGRGGAVPELGFFFKKPEGAHASATYEDQLRDLKELEAFCRRRLAG